MNEKGEMEEGRVEAENASQLPRKRAPMRDWDTIRERFIATINEFGVLEERFTTTKAQFHVLGTKTTADYNGISRLIATARDLGYIKTEDYSAPYLYDRTEKEASLEVFKAAHLERCKGKPVATKRGPRGPYKKAAAKAPIMTQPKDIPVEVMNEKERLHRWEQELMTKEHDLRIVEERLVRAYDLIRMSVKLSSMANEALDEVKTVTEG